MRVRAGGEHERLVIVPYPPDEVRRRAVGAANLDDVPDLVRAVDDRAFHHQPVPWFCMHVDLHSSRSDTGDPCVCRSSIVVVRAISVTVLSRRVR